MEILLALLVIILIWIMAVDPAGNGPDPFDFEENEDLFEREDE